MNNNDTQMNMFDCLFENYKITKPIRLIEFFAGYGSQALALKYLGVKFEHWKISEWAINSIQAYKDLHFEDYCFNWSCELSDDEVLDELTKTYVVSKDYNTPATREQLKKMNFRKIYNNIITTHNLGSICNVHSIDLAISDLDKFTYLLTYSFPCVPKGTMIYTINGYKPIEEIKEDELVLTHNNRFKKVVKTMNRVSSHIYHIKAIGINDLKITGEHPLYVYRDNKFQWIKTKDLKLTDKLSMNVNTNSIDVDLTNEEMWLLGRYVADGNINKYTYNSIDFAISFKKEGEFLNNIPNDYKPRFKKVIKSCYDYRIADKRLKDLCMQFGNGAKNKKVPQWVLDLPKEKLQYFFDGYISGDGHIRERCNSKQIMFSTVSEELFLSMQQIIAKLYGCICSCYVRKDNRKETYNDTYNCQFNIVGKRLWQEKIEDKIIFKINSIDYEEKPIEVYNLEIDEDNSYTTNNVIVHNCQDLSLAGKKKGMKDTSTRSGLLWEVERILKECKASGKLPQVLLMENVPEVIGVNNVSDFAKWRHTLEELGYSNYVECLNGVNYGIPQSRNRCFMISILGEYNYNFPKPIKLEKHLTDLLEENVDSKYYLTSSQIESVKQWNAQQKPLEQLEKTSKINISPTLTTRTSAYAASMILVKDKLEPKVVGGFGNKCNNDKQFHQQNRIYDNKVALCLSTAFNPYYVTKDNLKSKLCNELIEKEHLKVGDVIKHSYTGQILDGKKKPIERRDNIMVTLTTRADCLGVVYLDENGLGIRKLTPKECFRLMGVKDEDFEKIKENQSEMSLYHLAGDSIICNVLCAIFKQLF